MRIGFLAQAIFALGNPGNGVAAQARFQAAALRELGHDVVMLNPWDWRDISEFDVVQFFIGGFGVYGVEQFAGRIGRGALVYAPIIDSNEPNWRYRLASELGCRFPKIFTIPGEFRKQALASDVVVCRSVFEQTRVVKGLGIPESRTAIVLNGVELPSIAEQDLQRGAAIRSELDIVGDYVLHVSAYTQGRKNVASLIKAAGPLGFPVVIAGWNHPGPELDELNQLVAQYSNVRLMGFLPRDQLNALYAGCRVFCLPSSHEGTGLVALEAAAYGANVVITRHGGPPDYFKEWAEYVEPTDISNIGEAIYRAWNRPRDGELRRHVVEHLSWVDSAKSLERTYTRVLNEKSGSFSVNSTGSH